MNKEIASLGNLASWIDKEAKKESLAKGRTKLYKERRESGEKSFKDYHIKSLKIGKLKQYRNFLGLHLFKSGIKNITKLLVLSKRLNTPHYYRSNESFIKAITVIVEVANKEKRNVLTFDKALILVNKSLESKVSKQGLK